MGSTPLEGQWDAEPVDIPRYVASLRRGRGLILVIVASMTAAVFVISSLLPKTYETSARIVMDDRPGGAEPADAETVQRRLATVGALITTREVRERAAARLRGETSATLEDKVRATVDENANIVEIHATDNDSQGAAEIANTLAREFIQMQRAGERQRLARARTALEGVLARLRSQSPQADAIRDRLSELRLSEAAAGSELELAEPAQPPRTASSPRPIRNAIFAFFASVFLAVLAALGLGQLAPRVAGARDLGLLTGIPVVAHVPRARRRRDLQTVDEAYEELQTALALRLSTESKIVVVSGAQGTDEASAVAAGLARTLAESGSTLLLSADLWRPHVHEVLGLPRSPGLAELLSSVGGEASPSALAHAAHSIDVGEGSLDVLTAGGPVRNPAGVLGAESFADLVLELECSDYRHVVVEAPALLGSVHVQLVARYADAMLVVCDPERLSPSDAVELGQFLRSLDPPFAGLVILARAGGAAVPVVSAPPRRERAQADV
jgi:succinoglycan biosynthesis transport protein ExoP